ncbi:MAG TPA: hypothetical protein VHU85_14920 [Acidimicrobiales bacterium]|nr:hypothetical protein [Acidimicrobiales bacterium]
MGPTRTLDLSSALAPDREYPLSTPPDIPYWAENMLFTLYDPTADFGLWLHLGTVPTDWSMWEDIVLGYLPGDGGLLHMTSYHRTPAERRPAGSNLSFTCLEPFRRWKLEFDGRCLLSEYEQLRQGRALDSVKHPLAFELTVECATPVWDAHTSATIGDDRGSMRGQSWATDHYQQLFTVQGPVQLPEGEIEFKGTGWRDHSRGPRHGGTGATWGGHAIVNCFFPDSGRGFGLTRMWDPDGELTLDAGFVVDADGVLHHAEVLEVPRFYEPRVSGDEIPIGLGYPGGEVRLLGRTVKETWMTRNHALARGVEREGKASILAEAFARFEWDGEVGYGLCERSEHLNDPAGELRPPAP